MYAHFGAPGQHTIYVVNATDLGVSLINYYRDTVDANIARKEKLRQLNLPADHPLLKETSWPGIPMNTLLKGLREEASVTVKVERKGNKAPSH